MIWNVGVSWAFSLGVLYVSASYDPDLVYSSYMTLPFCTPSAATVYPRSVLDLQLMVLNARLFGWTLKANGARHSVTDTICTGSHGIPIIMKNFDYIKVNPDSTVTVGAGATLGKTLRALSTHGRTFLQLPGYLGLTVGGAVGTGAHGSSLRHPASLSELVVGMTVIDGHGILRVINGPDLDIFRIHLGVLGIIVDVTFQTVPLFKMEVTRSVCPDTILTDGSAHQIAQDSDYAQMAWFPSKRKILVVCGKNVSATIPGNATTTLFNDVSEEEAYKLQSIYDKLQDLRHIPGLQAVEDYSLLSLSEKVVDRVPIQTEDFITLKNPAVGYRYEITSGECKECHWNYGNHSLRLDEMGFGCSLSEWVGIVTTIRNIYEQIPFYTPFGIVFRFHPNAKALLSMAYGMGNGIVIVDIIAYARTDYNSMAKCSLGAYQAMAQALFQKHNCRPHWGKNGLHWSSKDAIAKAFPDENLRKFRTAMRWYDPFGIFRNKFSQRLLGIGDEKDTDPGTTRCALRDSCICQRDRDCAADQICGGLEDKDRKDITYYVCKDKVASNWPKIDPASYNAHNLSDIFRAIFSLQSENWG